MANSADALKDLQSRLWNASPIGAGLRVASQAGQTIQDLAGKGYGMLKDLDRKVTDYLDPPPPAPPVDRSKNLGTYLRPKKTAKR